MPIEFDNPCPDGKHNFSPIIEGNQTVGLKCSQCPFEVRENMEYSRFTVGDPCLITTKDIHEGERKRRKDPRF